MATIKRSTIQRALDNIARDLDGTNPFDPLWRSGDPRRCSDCGDPIPNDVAPTDVCDRCYDVAIVFEAASVVEALAMVEGPLAFGQPLAR